MHANPLNRSLIVWKLVGAIALIIVVVIGASGYLNNVSDRHYALESARDVSRFNSDVLLESIRRLMMTRDNEGIKEFIDNLDRDHSVYRDIRLVSHEGQVAASSSDPRGTLLRQESRSCRACHGLDDPLEGLRRGSRDEVIELPGGERVVSVVTPILNERGCKTAACHAHAESGPLLGFLQTDFSLSKVDARVVSRAMQTVLAVVVAILLGTGAAWLMMDRMLERPISALMVGMLRIAGNDLGFKVDVHGSDEMALLAKSFNEMSARLASKHAELEETRDYLEGVVKHTADIIITVDPAGLIRTFNDGAEKALGFQSSEVVGRRMETLFADPSERSAALKRLRDGDNVVNYSTRFLTKSGESRDVILTLSRLRKKDGTPIGTYGISKDVTREKRLQQKLLQSERFAAIGQAFTGIQHAMKNMLSALKGGRYMVNVGIAKGDERVLKDGWEMVQDGISRLGDMSRSILDYVKGHALRLERVDLGALASKVHAAVRQTAEGKGVRVLLRRPSGVPETLCDPGAVHASVMDLVSNALDACLSKSYPPGKSPWIVIAVKPTRSREWVAIEVRDNGPGMTEKVKKNIFTPFFSTKERSGTGLGLALTSRIIDEHGGLISVESAPGRGAKFRIVMPVDGPGEKKEEYNG